MAEVRLLRFWEARDITNGCHVRATTYKNRTLRLRVREADRFNERFGIGEVESGGTLIL